MELTTKQMLICMNYNNAYMFLFVLVTNSRCPTQVTQNISVSAEQQGQVTADIAARMNQTAERVSVTDISLTHVRQASGDVASAADDVLGGVQNVELAASGMEAALTTFVDRVHML